MVKRAEWPGLHRVKDTCLGVVLLDIRGPLAPEESLFTPRERKRALSLGPRRLKGFVAARIALKGLARQLGLAKGETSDCAIETLDSDGVRPCLGRSGLHCSVSHTAFYVVAVAHGHPVGVDLEVISDKAARGMHLFMTPHEQALIVRAGLARERGATRAWTMKEAAAKALGLDLAQVIREVEVAAIGEDRSLIRHGSKEIPVLHAEFDGHVLSLVASCGLEGLSYDFRGARDLQGI